MMNSRIYLDSPSNDILEFQTQKFHSDDYWTSYSLPFWMSRSFTDSDDEASHLLYKDCTSSPRSSRYRAIEDGRKVLMELMENMPESSYELSLKDIVDEQQNLEKEARKEMMSVEKPLVHKPHEVNSKKDKTASTSMNSRVFLLKMFIPVPLAFKAVKKRSSSRIISSPSFDGSEKLMAKDRCKIRMAFSEKRNRKKCDNINKARYSAEKASNREPKNPVCWTKVCEQCHSYAAVQVASNRDRSSHSCPRDSLNLMVQKSVSPKGYY